MAKNVVASECGRGRSKAGMEDQPAGNCDNTSNPPVEAVIVVEYQALQAH